MKDKIRALREAAPWEVQPLLAVLDVLAARAKAIREEPDRGDVSITTVIMWVFGIGAAITIVAALARVVAKYVGKTGGL